MLVRVRVGKVENQHRLQYALALKVNEKLGLAQATLVAEQGLTRTASEAKAFLSWPQ